MGDRILQVGSCEECLASSSFDLHPALCGV